MSIDEIKATQRGLDRLPSGPSTLGALSVALGFLLVNSGRRSPPPHSLGLDSIEGPLPPVEKTRPLSVDNSMAPPRTGDG